MHGGWNSFSYFSLYNRSSLGWLCNRIIGLRNKSMKKIIITIIASIFTCFVSLRMERC